MPRDVGDWAQDKLKILRLYLPGYLQATTKARERIYIDAFAGPGSNRLKVSGQIIDGSPLLALDAEAQNGTKFDRLFFIEQEPVIARELRGELEKRDPQHRAEVIVGDVNRELPRVVQKLPLRSPTFVFLDTDSIEPQWSTIEAIASSRTELLVNFPLAMAINRNLDSPKVTAYFGTDDWRPISRSLRTDRTRGLLDLYKNRLARLGYPHATEDDRLIRASRGHHLYYLFLVSKVPAAKNIMTWVLKQPDASGQARLNL